MVQNATYGLNLRSGREQSTASRPSVTVVTRNSTEAREQHEAVRERLVGLALIATTTLFGSWLLWSLSHALETYQIF
jgi:hypothetical protein